MEIFKKLVDEWIDTETDSYDEAFNIVHGMLLALTEMNVIIDIEKAHKYLASKYNK